jgi:hypothetical protein
MKPFPKTSVTLAMKTLRFTLVVTLGVAALAGLHAAESKQKAPSRVEVVYSEPDKFSDAADGPRGSEFGKDTILADLESFIVQRAESRIPEGQHLTVTVTDIDLAGEVEPGRTGGSDVRIVKSIYMPRIDLTYRLTDASGAVIKEGKNQLRDMNFMNNINPIRSEPRFHERELLGRWIDQEFGRSKKK